LRGLLADQNVQAAVGPVTEDALLALRSLHTDPFGVAKAVERAAASLAGREDVTPPMRRIAAALHELAALLSAHAEFFILCGRPRGAA
jgi:hypothetical protein